MTSSKMSTVPYSARDLAQPFEVALGGRHAAHVPGDGLQDDRGESLALSLEELPHRLEVVVRQDGGISSRALRDAGASGRPRVATPEPAETSRASPWPW